MWTIQLGEESFGDVAELVKALTGWDWNKIQFEEGWRAATYYRKLDEYDRMNKPFMRGYNAAKSIIKSLKTRPKRF